MEGKYISREYIWKEIMKLNDEEIVEMKRQMTEEKKEFPEDDGF